MGRRPVVPRLQRPHRPLVVVHEPRELVSRFSRRTGPRLKLNMIRGGGPRGPPPFFVAPRRAVCAVRARSASEGGVPRRLGTVASSLWVAPSLARGRAERGAPTAPETPAGANPPRTGLPSHPAFSGTFAPSRPSRGADITDTSRHRGRLLSGLPQTFPPFTGPSPPRTTMPRTALSTPGRRAAALLPLALLCVMPGCFAPPGRPENLHRVRRRRLHRQRSSGRPRR